MTASLASLPQEIYDLILAQLQTSEPLHALLALTLVSRFWHSLAIPFIYQHVVLDAKNMRTFNKVMCRSGLTYIHSLSIDLMHCDPETATPEFFGTLNESLLRLAAAMPAMDCLQSFSFRIAPPALRHFMVTQEPPLSSMAALLASLPQTCEALELDLANTSWRPFGHKDNYHICPHISNLLPRLRYLRLRLLSLCGSLVGLSPDGSSVHLPHWHTPNLLNLVLNCVRAYRCDILGRSRSSSFMASLLATKAQSGGLPFLEAGFVIDESSTTPVEERLSNNAGLRFDAKNRKLTAIPFKRFSFEPPVHFICTPEYPDAVAEYPAIGELLEGHQWRCLRRPRGARLPSERIAQYDRAKDDFWPNRSCWASEYPDRKSLLWIDETNTGETLLSPQVRDGFSDRSRLVQRIPTGWMAPVYHDQDISTMYGQLELDDGESCAYLSGGAIRCPHDDVAPLALA